MTNTPTPRPVRRRTNPRPEVGAKLGYTPEPHTIHASIHGVGSLYRVIGDEDHGMYVVTAISGAGSARDEAIPHAQIIHVGTGDGASNYAMALHVACYAAIHEDIVEEQGR